MRCWTIWETVFYSPLFNGWNIDLFTLVLSLLPFFRATVLQRKVLFTWSTEVITIESLVIHFSQGFKKSRWNLIWQFKAALFYFIFLQYWFVAEKRSLWKQKYFARFFFELFGKTCQKWSIVISATHSRTTR